MSGIKKNHGHNDGHHHLATVSRKGHSYTYLHCDSKIHHHAGKSSVSKHEGFEQYLVAVDGKKVASTNSHANHHNTVKHTADDQKPISAHKKHKNGKTKHLGHHGGEAANNLRRKTRKAAATPKTIASDTKKPAIQESAESKNTTSQTAPSSDNKTPQVQQNLAQFIAANSDSVTKYPIGQDGKPSAESAIGIAIVKDKETGKLLAFGEMMSSIELSSQDPANLSPEDKAKIEAAIKAGTLKVGNLAEEPAATPAPATGAATNSSGANGAEGTPTPANQSGKVAPETGAGTNQGEPNNTYADPAAATQPATGTPNGDGTTTLPAKSTNPAATNETPEVK